MNTQQAIDYAYKIILTHLLNNGCTVEEFISMSNSYREVRTHAGIKQGELKPIPLEL